jgi:hypothetical protein
MFGLKGNSSSGIFNGVYTKAANSYAPSQQAIPLQGTTQGYQKQPQHPTRASAPWIAANQRQHQTPGMMHQNIPLPQQQLPAGSRGRPIVSRASRVAAASAVAVPSVSVLEETVTQLKEMVTHLQETVIQLEAKGTDQWDHLDFVKMGPFKMRLLEQSLLYADRDTKGQVIGQLEAGTVLKTLHSIEETDEGMWCGRTNVFIGEDGLEMNTHYFLIARLVSVEPKKFESVVSIIVNSHE